MGCYAKLLTTSCYLYQDANRRSQEAARNITMELKAPRIILAEFNKHGTIRSSAASSRAVPVKLLVQQCYDDPYIPDWTRNQAGMQGNTDKPFTDDEKAELTARYLDGRDRACEEVLFYEKKGVHKQDANRLIEPYLWHTVCATGTTYIKQGATTVYPWQNFLDQRNHYMAHPAMQDLALCVQEVMDSIHYNTRVSNAATGDLTFPHGEKQLLHLPYLSEAERAMSLGPAVLCSIARVARVSTNRQEDARGVDDEIKFVKERLLYEFPYHWLPFEQVCASQPGLWGVYQDWKSIRRYMEEALQYGGDARSALDVLMRVLDRKGKLA